MTITYKKNLAVFGETVSIEDAEELLQWLQKSSKGKIDALRCTHLHAAILQLLMAARVPLAAWPQDDGLRAWLTIALKT